MMQKLDFADPTSRSADPITQNIAALTSLFPELLTEGPNGAAINVDVLKALVGNATATDADEKYGLNWFGKRRARRLALAPSTGTLRPCPEESVDWDTTQNIMIEGDNLEVLKLLQKSYAGKVKLIYIDPPYNTGKDFIYPDDYRDNIRNYLELTGQVEGGRRISSNTESSGRFHTDWLNMIYPRLALARSLLRPDGLMMISVGDQEAQNLRAICDELFGEDQFIAALVWNTEGHTDNQFDVKVNHEYIMLVARNADSANLGHVVDPNTREQSNLWKGFAENSITKNGPANPPSEIRLPTGFPCSEDRLSLPPSRIAKEFFTEAEAQGHITRELTERFNAVYPVRLDSMSVVDGKLTAPCRVFSGWANVNKLRAFIDNRCQPIEDGSDGLTFYLSAKGVIYYRRERERARNILSVLRNLGTTERMRSELEAFGVPFDYPKPKELLRYLVRIGAEESSLVLDFFAGSGTLLHSIWLQDLECETRHRTILVQLPEPLDPGDDRQRPAIRFCDSLGYPSNSAELTKERLRRVAKNIKDKNPLFAGDLGFRVFKLDSTNIRAWDPDRNDIAKTLEGSVDHLKSDRTEQDILYEVLLKLGLDLCVPIDKRTIANATVHSVGGGVLIVCLATVVATEHVEALGQGIVAWRKELAPAGDTACVFRDSAFADDVAKTNLAAILEQNGIATVRSL